MLEILNSVDVDILYWINGHHSVALDRMMIFASGKFTWIVFYLYLLFLMVRKYKYKTLLVLLFVAVGITVSDQVSVHLFKNVFLRLRPCHQPDVMENLRMIVGCGGQYGFVSSHAANSFSLVTFVVLLFKNRWIGFTMLLWGSLVIYSRVYLGVHYPSDVMVGSVVGVVSGFVAFYLFIITHKKLGEIST